MRRRANKEEGGTTKRVFAAFLTAALLLGLLSVGASATETKYAPLTLSNRCGATLTIDKAHVIYAGKPADKNGENFECPIYCVPDGAQITVTVTGAQEGVERYIGAKFDLLSDGGNANTGGTVMKSAEYILNADNVLQRVYLSDENSNALEKDDSWIGSAGVIRQNGTYSFTLPAADYAGWSLSLMYGPRDGPHFAETDPDDFHGFLLDYFDYPEKDDENVPWIGLTAESASGESGNPFTDVAAGAYCYDGVQWAVKQGITAGKTATTFAPGETCTKGQILTFLWRANGQPEPSAANPFTDVTQSNYYYKAALWAVEQGLVFGSVLGASAPCTRAMTMTYLWTLGGKPAAQKSAAYTDVATDAAYAKAVAWAVEKGITSGKTANTFAPADTCTRGQIATFLYRAMH